MPTDKQELERRVALTTAQHQVRGFNFTAVLSLVEKKVGAPTARELGAPAGRRFLSFFNYPAADFLRLTFHAADALETTYGGVDRALRALGEATSRALLETTVGRTLVNFARGSVPHQVFKHTPTAYGMAVTFGERTVLQLDERRSKLIILGDMRPASLHEGIVAAGLSATGVQAHITSTSTGLDSCELLLDWTDTRPPQPW